MNRSGSYFVLGSYLALNIEVTEMGENDLALLVVIAIVLVTGVFLLRHLVRTFFYPIPGNMPPLVEGESEVHLQRFEATLRDHTPEGLASLRPGLADDEIEQLEREYGIRLTEELAALYRWRDGAAPDAQFDIIPGHRFVPLGEALHERSGLRQQVAETSVVQRLAYAVFAGHRTGWLTVFDDGAGDGYFYDPARARRRGSFFYCFAEVRTYHFFPSLGNFLAGATECYETGIYRGGSRTQINEDFERAEALWSRYASSPTL